jgi:hypothetical protein
MGITKEVFQADWSEILKMVVKGYKSVNKLVYFFNKIYKWKKWKKTKTMAIEYLEMEQPFAPQEGARNCLTGGTSFDRHPSKNSTNPHPSHYHKF